jgi:hypothetical protein
MCLVHKAGSLSVVEYGSNDVLAVCRTKHMSPYLLSAADVEARGTSPAVKRVAYLLDLQTIRVIDLLAGGQSLATISHDAKVDWLVRVVARTDGFVWSFLMHCSLRQYQLVHSNGRLACVRVCTWAAPRPVRSSAVKCSQARRATPMLWWRYRSQLLKASPSSKCVPHTVCEAPTHVCKATKDAAVT